jgi:hypothetical protein
MRMVVFCWSTETMKMPLLAFERELKNWPKHTLARCQIANIKLRNRDIEGGLPLARKQ